MDNQDGYLQKTSEYLKKLIELSTVPTLKSHYTCKYRKIKTTSKCSKTEIQETCPRCCLKYEGTSKKSIKPEKRVNKFGKKILKKQNNGKRLTMFQTKYLKKLRNKDENFLVTHCIYCKTEIKKSLKKPIKETAIVVETPKKKKKKKKFSNLNPAYVLQAKNNQTKPPEIETIDLTNSFSNNKEVNLDAILNRISNNPKKKGFHGNKQKNNNNKSSPNKNNTSTKIETIDLTKSKNKKKKKNQMRKLQETVEKIQNKPSNKLNMFLQGLK